MMRSRSRAYSLRYGCGCSGKRRPRDCSARIGQGAGVGTGSMGRSIIFRLTRANACPRNGSGFRRKRIQTAISLIRNGSIWEIFFDLLVDTNGLFRIRIAKEARKFQQYQWPRHKCTLLIGQITETLYVLLTPPTATLTKAHLILPLP